MRWNDAFIGDQWCGLNVESCGIPFLYKGLLDTFGVGETCLDASSSTVKGLRRDGRIPSRSFTKPVAVGTSCACQDIVCIVYSPMWSMDMNISNIKKLWLQQQCQLSYFLEEDSLAETAPVQLVLIGKIHQGLNMAHKQQFPALEFSHLLASNFGRTLKMGTSLDKWLLISPGEKIGNWSNIP